MERRALSPGLRAQEGGDGVGQVIQGGTVWERDLESEAALFVAFEGFALVKRFRWTMRSPKEIARARREAREREEAR